MLNSISNYIVNTCIEKYAMIYMYMDFLLYINCKLGITSERLYIPGRGYRTVSFNTQSEHAFILHIKVRILILVGIKSFFSRLNYWL